MAVRGYAQTDIVNRRTEGRSSSQDTIEYLQARVQALEDEVNKYKHISEVRVELLDKNNVCVMQTVAKHVLVKPGNDGIADLLIFEK